MHHLTQNDYQHEKVKGTPNAHDNFRVPISLRFDLGPAAFNGGIRFKVCFQTVEIISPTANWIRWCMQAYAGVGVMN